MRRIRDESLNSNKVLGKKVIAGSRRLELFENKSDSKENTS